MRVRWAPKLHPIPADAVEERAAIRYDGELTPEVRVLEADDAVRVFMRRGAGSPWTSAYLHDLREADAVLEELEGRLA